MADTVGHIKNVIFCEDIREEIGNKKSLMGVAQGDLLVAAFPAVIQMAVFFEYASHEGREESVSLNFRLMQDDTEIARGNMTAEISSNRRANFIIPKGFVNLEKPATLKLLASVNDGAEQEILSKTVLLTPRSSTTTS